MRLGQNTGVYVFADDRLAELEDPKGIRQGAGLGKIEDYREYVGRLAEAFQAKATTAVYAQLFFEQGLLPPLARHIIPELAEAYFKLASNTIQRCPRGPAYTGAIEDLLHSLVAACHRH